MIRIEDAALEALYRLYTIAIENHNDGRMYSYDQASLFHTDFPTFVGEVPLAFRDGVFELLEEQKKIRRESGTLIGELWVISGKGIAEVEQQLEIEGSIPWSLDQERSDTLSAIDDHIPTTDPFLRGKEATESATHVASGDLQSGPASISAEAEVIPASDRYVSVSDNQDAFNELAPVLEEIESGLKSDRFQKSNSIENAKQNLADISAFITQMKIGEVAKKVADNLMATLKTIQKIAAQVGITAGTIGVAITAIEKLFS